MLWQYSNRGRVDGIDAYVDINAFKGSQADFDFKFKGKAILTVKIIAFLIGSARSVCSKDNDCKLRLQFQ